MTDYEFLMKMYPQWYIESGIITFIKIFLLLSLFLVIPFVYVKFVETRLIIFLHHVEEKISLKYDVLLHRVKPY
jgi:hypothetical protein